MIPESIFKKYPYIEKASIEYILGNELIRNNVAIMTFGGSYAYGTNKEGKISLFFLEIILMVEITVLRL